jgi:hypothetical protein
MLDGIRSESRTPSPQNAWTDSIGICTERGDVCEEIIGDDSSLSTHVLDDAIEVDGVPMDDRGGDEAHGTRTPPTFDMTMRSDRQSSNLSIIMM